MLTTHASEYTPTSVLDKQSLLVANGMDNLSHGETNYTDFVTLMHEKAYC